MIVLDVLKALNPEQYVDICFCDVGKIFDTAGGLLDMVRNNHKHNVAVKIGTVDMGIKEIVFCPVTNMYATDSCIRINIYPKQCDAYIRKGQTLVEFGVEIAHIRNELFNMGYDEKASVKLKLDICINQAHKSDMIFVRDESYLE